jgi:hypothetical protein
MDQMDQKNFKQCPYCHYFFSLREILESPEVEPVGMRFDEDEPGLNLYFFSHVCLSCGTTFAIEVDRFEPLITEPIPDKVLAGTKNCEQHCLNIEDLKQCQQECRYAPFRRFILSLIKKKRRHTAATKE